MIKILDRPVAPKVPYVIGKDEYHVLNDFFQTLMKNKNIDNLDLFFYNVSTLEMKPSTIKDMSSPTTLAEYSVIFNYIRFIKDVFKIAISHELLHLASSLNTDECQFSGFSQFQKVGNILIGIGLNEGYTWILDNRYFNDYVEGKDEYLKDTYMVIRNIAGMLEDLVGRENMEKWYFNADLKSLVEYLCQFMDYDEVICFILALDNIFVYCDEGKILKPRIAMENYRYAVEFIGRCYINIFSQQLIANELSQEKYDELMGYVFKLMSQEIKFKKFSIFKSRKMSPRKFNKIVAYEQQKVLKKYI